MREYEQRVCPESGNGEMTEAMQKEERFSCTQYEIVEDHEKKWTGVLARTRNQ
jgi:hypothetical protein